jgi:RNA polymerase sigma-70 factor (ECF subfamily)
MERDERELIQQIRRGSPDGFRRLYDRHGERLMGFALHLTGSRAQAEDLVQDVFLAAYTGRASFQGRSRLISWLLGIAARRWRDQCRRPAITTTDLSDAEEMPSETAGSSIHHSLEAGVIDSLTLEAALARLDLPAREALLLVRSQGLTYQEAAQVMQEPVGTVKWRVSEATRKMQTFLNATEDFHELQPTPAGADPLSCRG